MASRREPEGSLTPWFGCRVSVLETSRASCGRLACRGRAAGWRAAAVTDHRACECRAGLGAVNASSLRSDRAAARLRALTAPAPRASVRPYAVAGWIGFCADGAHEPCHDARRSRADPAGE